MAHSNEIKRRCLTCGKVYCFSSDLIDMAKTSSELTKSSSILGFLTGNSIGSNVAVASNAANVMNILQQVKCPNCGSMQSEPYYGKISNADSPTNVEVTAPISINPNASIESLIERIEIFIEDNEWDKADAYCEHVLDMEPHNGYAYFMKFLISKKISDKEELYKNNEIFDSPFIQKAQKYADDDLRQILQNLEEKVKKYVDAENEIIFQEENVEFDKSYGSLQLTRRNLKYICGNGSVSFKLKNMSNVCAKEKYGYQGAKFGQTVPRYLCFDYEGNTNWFFCVSGNANQLAMIINENK